MAQNKISRDQVQHVARLARLQLDPQEEQRLAAELSEMLAYVDQLNQLDTSNVEPTAQVGEEGIPLRQDQVTNASAPEEMLSNAPSRKGTFFKVPRIIE